MSQHVALLLAAIALGLAAALTPVAAQPAHAGISVPLPPPSLTPPTKPKGQAQPAVQLVFATER